MTFIELFGLGFINLIFAFLALDTAKNGSLVLALAIGAIPLAFVIFLAVGLVGFIRDIIEEKQEHNQEDYKNEMEILDQRRRTADLKYAAESQIARAAKRWSKTKDSYIDTKMDGIIKSIQKNELGDVGYLMEALRAVCELTEAYLGLSVSAKSAGGASLRGLVDDLEKAVKAVVEDRNNIESMRFTSEIKGVASYVSLHSMASSGLTVNTESCKGKNILMRSDGTLEEVAK